MMMNESIKYMRNAANISNPSSRPRSQLGVTQQSQASTSANNNYASLIGTAQPQPKAYKGAQQSRNGYANAAQMGKAKEFFTQSSNVNHSMYSIPSKQAQKKDLIANIVGGSVHNQYSPMRKLI